MEQSNKTLLPKADKTNIKDWAFEELTLKDVTPQNVDVSSYVPEGAKNAVVLVDGHIAFMNIKDGVTISSDANIDVKEENKLVVLNADKKNSMFSLNIAKNTVVDEPIYIVYVAKERSIVHQGLITLETGAQAEIVETFVSEKSENANILSKTVVGENANLKSSIINRLNGKAVIYYHRLTEVQKDGALETTNFLIHDSNIVFEDYTHLVGTGAEANVATVALADNSQSENITVRVENLAPRSNGNIVNYGIVKDTAHLAFNGIGKIHKGMKGVDNQQETRLLNLSVDAQAIANPFLLIDEGDITAGHAASIGQINPEQVYYLMSRGLSKQESEKMIVTGFLAPFADIIKDEKLKEQLLESIEVKLG